MARQLRPRKSQPSYASMIAIDDEETQAGPSSIAVMADEGSSGSEFEPEVKKAGGDEAEEEDEEENEEGEGEEEEDELEDDELSNSSKPKRKRGSTAVSVVSASRAPSKSAKTKPKASSVKSLIGPGHSFARATTKRQMYALPAPSVNHRHRAMPLYSRSGRVERLLSLPKMFRPNAVTMTNSFTQGSKVTDWVNKSWGYNVGWGPLWELVEDRGWYKEAKKREGDEDGMESCRRPRVYESVRVKDGWEILSKETRNYKQYLAIAPFTSNSHSPEIGVKVHRPSYACDKGVMRCEMVLCLQGGPAFELKWCPLPAHDELDDDTRPRKLGILAGTFEDGSLSIYVVPQPEDVTPEGHDPSQPVSVKMSDPLIRIDLEDTEVIAIGTTNGIIAVYNLSAALKSCTSSTPTITDLLPTHYLTIHQSAIRALSWIRAPSSWPSGTPRTDEDPTVIASGGYDGVECMTDIREGHGSVMNRTRDVINTMTFSPFTGGPITIDHENTVKAYSVSPSMLGRGHTLLEPQGLFGYGFCMLICQTVHASDYHPQLAVGSADGTCSTTNTLKSTRRGGSVPFFLHKIYQMDYSRNTKEFRMVERNNRPPTATRAAKTKKPVPMPPAGTGAWQPEVGVHRVVWNTASGLAGAGMLASATASGLCRVDILWGRWMKGKIPYGGIEGFGGKWILWLLIPKGRSLGRCWDLRT
ncbi:hypothetical protein BDQ17DRAFT_1352845 [Cyathus striatus]|nr:hypothetical protein BDQ17DRAFT_1352845 [Cyathus striatus]